MFFPKIQTRDNPQVNENWTGIKLPSEYEHMNINPIGWFLYY